MGLGFTFRGLGLLLGKDFVSVLLGSNDTVRVSIRVLQGLCFPVLTGFCCLCWLKKCSRLLLAALGLKALGTGLTFVDVSTQIEVFGSLQAFGFLECRGL